MLNSPTLPLLLASTSPSRRVLLSRLRVPFEVVAPSYEEPPLPRGHHEDAAVHAMALERARGKATSVAEINPGAVVIGSDQICLCEGELFGKPGTEERAIEQLTRLAGREHRLVGALVVAGPERDRWQSAVIETPLRLRKLRDDEIRAYVALERPLDSAGAYYMESLGIALFESIGGDDPTAIQGLPLITLVAMLEAAGYRVLANAR